VTNGFRGAIFDVDGVLVDSPHERAWREALRELMEGDWRDIAGDTSYAPSKFTPRVYQDEVAGKPRMSGARAALNYFGVPDAERRTEFYAERKQRMVLALIRAGEFDAYPDALRFAMAARASRIRLAAASSSKNAALMLKQIRLDTFAWKQGLAYDFLRPGLTLLDLFDVNVSGRDLARGKPHPEIFLTAADELGLPPSACFVVEDAVAGIEAAKAGEMAALGVARANDAEVLAAAHADLVVTTLDDVDVDRIPEGRLRRRLRRASAG
jgi:beta-phosphoglucomutase-like phosphatase (HAD superfamily)